eukprot:7953998-Pyramimonas_sp.AAC.1
MAELQDAQSGAEAAQVAAARQVGLHAGTAESATKTLSKAILGHGWEKQRHQISKYKYKYVRPRRQVAEAAARADELRAEVEALRAEVVMLTPRAKEAATTRAALDAAASRAAKAERESREAKRRQLAAEVVFRSLSPASWSPASSPPAIGSYAGYILPPLLRLVLGARGQGGGGGPPRGGGGWAGGAVRGGGDELRAAQTGAGSGVP